MTGYALLLLQAVLVILLFAAVTVLVRIADNTRTMKLSEEDRALLSTHRRRKTKPKSLEIK